MATVVLFWVFYPAWTIRAEKRKRKNKLANEPALDFGVCCLHKQLTARTSYFFKENIKSDIHFFNKKKLQKVNLSGLTASTMEMYKTKTH